MAILNDEMASKIDFSEFRFSNFRSFPKLGHTMDVWIYSSVAHDYGIFLQTYFFIWYIKILKVKL